MIGRIIFILIFYFALVVLGIIQYNPSAFLVYFVVAVAIGFAIEYKRGG